MEDPSAPPQQQNASGGIPEAAAHFLWPVTATGVIDPARGVRLTQTVKQKTSGTHEP